MADCGSGCLFELFGPQENPLTHHLAGFKFDGGPGWDNNIFLGLVGIPANAGFRQSHFKNTKIPKLHIPAIREGIGDLIQRFLEHLKNLRLDQSCFFADGSDDVLFSEVWHGGLSWLTWQVTFVSKMWTIGQLSRRNFLAKEGRF